MTTATITVRHAVRADAPRLREIYNQAVAGRISTCDLEPLPLTAVEAWFDGRDVTTRPVYAAVADGTVAGYLSVSDFWNDRPGYRTTADCGLYVGAEHQGRGVGGRLLRHFLGHARELGIDTVVTSMFADNEASVRLFRKAGFTRVGLCPGVANLDGVRKDLALVQRTVDP
ncbi:MULTISPECIES: GNAT family N-acetyltransferase [Streptomyces]|uniref:N-acetyltransferase family protein n=1 Tax=Streptomyces ramulosus TaxID=47762 RepID=A0ABW1FV25_9ACTN